MALVTLFPEQSQECKSSCHASSDLLESWAGVAQGVLVHTGVVTGGESVCLYTRH